MLQNISALYVYQMETWNGNTEHTLFFPLTKCQLLCGPGWHLSSGQTDLKKMDLEVFQACISRNMQEAYFNKTISCIYLIGEYNL